MLDGGAGRWCMLDGGACSTVVHDGGSTVVARRWLDGGSTVVARRWWLDGGGCPWVDARGWWKPRMCAYGASRGLYLSVYGHGHGYTHARTPHWHGHRCHECTRSCTQEVLTRLDRELRLKAYAYPRKPLNSVVKLVIKMAKITRPWPK